MVDAPRAGLRSSSRRSTSRRTVSVALIVGTVFFAMNQLGVILDGRATAAGLGQGRPDVSDSAARLQLRDSVGDPTDRRPTTNRDR